MNNEEFYELKKRIEQLERTVEILLKEIDILKQGGNI